MDSEGRTGSYAVVLSPRAIRDLEVIVGYIAVDDPVAAEYFGLALIGKTELLSDFPDLGKRVPDLDRALQARELVYGSYRIIYRVDHRECRVEVSRFWHGARGTPVI